jgi:D-ala D-ala ligase N-terminal domain protein
VLNALACIAVARLAGVDFARIQGALAEFHGAKRRFQTKGKERGVWVVDDYAHHPTEIAVTLAAARQTNPGRLICVFQPHRYSRTQLLRSEFGGCFRAADLLLLTDVYAAGEAPIPGISGKTLMEEVAEQTGQNAVYLPDRTDLERYLAQHVRAGDLVITMGAGNILEVGEALVERLKDGTAGADEPPIVVVMGGPSTEAEVSRRSGGAILQALTAKGYPAVGLELNPPDFAAEIQKLCPAIVFNALHGKYGEDGILQGTLDMLGIPYTGSGVRAAALTMDKLTAKRIFRAEGIATPHFRVLYAGERDAHTAERIQEEFGLPVVVKAPEQGSSIGVHIITRAEELDGALDDVFTYGSTALVEEFIRGRELTVVVWGTPADAEALPVIEITTASGRYDYESKYTPGASTHIVPAEISEECTAAVQSLAVHAFAACGCSVVARVDVMLSGEGVPYAIEVNAVPGMTATSLVPDAARAVGIEFPELCEKILAMAGYRR